MMLQQKNEGNFFNGMKLMTEGPSNLRKKSNEAMNKLSQSVVMNTKAIEENRKAVAKMVNLLRAKLV